MHDETPMAMDGDRKTVVPNPWLWEAQNAAKKLIKFSGGSAWP
jgi:hypothetical protein